MKTEEIKQYLENGWYILFDKRRIVPLNKRNTILTLKDIARRKFFVKIQIFRKTKEYPNIQIKGNRLIYRKWDGQILIFDDHEKWFYRRYTNTKQYNSIKEGHSYLETYYQINKIHFESGLITKEKLLPGIALRRANFEIQNLVFNNIIDKLQNAVSNKQFKQTEKTINYQELFLRFSKTYYPEEMKDYVLTHKTEISELFKNLIWTWNHCDLSPDNILVHNDQYSLIDSEWCDSMPFLYDVINLILTLEIMVKNNTPFKNYFQGKHDDLLRIVLNKEEITENLRTNLFLIMLMLKGVIAWDVKRKSNDKALLKIRWETVKKIIA